MALALTSFMQWITFIHCEKYQPSSRSEPRAMCPYTYILQAIVAFEMASTSFKRTTEGTYVKTVSSRPDAYLYDWRFDQSWESNQDRILYASASKSASPYNL